MTVHLNVVSQALHYGFFIVYGLLIKVHFAHLDKAVADWYYDVQFYGRVVL